MTVENAKALVEMLMPLQEYATPGEPPSPCPRCGQKRMDPKPVRNALSRHAKVYICDICGMDEALRDMKGNPLPLNQWSIAVSVDDESGENNDCI